MPPPQLSRRAAPPDPQRGGVGARSGQLAAAVSDCPPGGDLGSLPEVTMLLPLGLAPLAAIKVPPERVLHAGRGALSQW